MSCYFTNKNSVFVQMSENRIGLIVWILQLSAQVVMNIHIIKILWATRSDFLLSTLVHTYVYYIPHSALIDIENQSI